MIAIAPNAQSEKWLRLLCFIALAIATGAIAHGCHTGNHGDADLRNKLSRMYGK